MPECKVCGRWISEQSEEQVERCRKRAILVRDDVDDYDDGDEYHDDSEFGYAR